MRSLAFASSAKLASPHQRIPQRAPNVVPDTTLPMRVTPAQNARKADILGFQRRSVKIAPRLRIPPLIPLVAFLAQLGALLRGDTRIAHCAQGV